MRREELTVSVEGRRVHAQLSGAEDGPLVVFNTGSPGSRHLWDEHLEEAASRGLRQVCLSRPGVEGSERLPGRSMGDCATDVAAVADVLGAESFYVVGHSFGGGAALACAALLADRVLAAASLSPLAPRDCPGLDWTGGMGEWNEEEFAAIEAGGATLEAFVESAFDTYRAIDTTEDLLGLFGDIVCPADRAVLQGSFLDFQLAGCRRYASGGSWGWYDDDVALWREWGFDLAAISVPVDIWSGGEDKFVPAAHAEWLVERIPGARLHHLPAEGHLSLWAKHYGSVLDELLASGRK
ncbi:MAG: alpha/beta hydrolase [Solirubrobacterales bacterium]